MNTRRSIKLMLMLLVGALAIMVPRWAMAAGTTAGQGIANQATVTYDAGGNPQTPLYSCDSTRNWTTECSKTSSNADDKTKFNVDRKINFTVTINPAGVVAKSVSPGEANVAFGYKITNTGNTTVTFNLSRVIGDTGSILTDEGTVRIFKDDDADGVKDAGETSQYANATTFGDVAADGSLYVIVVQNVENSAANGNTAKVDSFTVVAKDTVAASGADLSEIGTAGSGTAIVFADSGYDNSETETTDRVWTVGAPVLRVQKSQSLISDGAGGTSGYIPGATVEYTIRVTYDSGSGSATSISISDVIPTYVAAVANIAEYSSGGEVHRTTSTDGGTTPSVTDMNSGDAGLTWNTAAGSTVTMPCGIILDQTGDYCEMKFRVQIQ